jgi:hypothetical protein
VRLARIARRSEYRQRNSHRRPARARVRLFQRPNEHGHRVHHDLPHDAPRREPGHDDVHGRLPDGWGVWAVPPVGYRESGGVTLLVRCYSPLFIRWGLSYQPREMTDYPLHRGLLTC